MRTLKGPAIFLAQFAGEAAPFDTLEHICKWASSLGYKGVQIPTWVSGFIDLEKAATSKAYADDLNGIASKHGVTITELSTHLQGQLVAVHPAYDTAFDGFAPASVHNNPRARQAWAVQTMMHAAKASKNLGLTEHATFSGALAWPYVYPWPQRPAGLVEEARRDGRAQAAQLPATPLGISMMFDHRRILATAIARLRGKMKYRPVVFELMPPTFTLLELQRVVEAISGVRLHKQNFRRLIEAQGLVEGTGKSSSQSRGRPAELFRFRREVLAERPVAGVRLTTRLRSTR